MHFLWSNSGSTNPFLFQTFFPPSVSVNSGLFIDEIIYSYLPPSHPTQENMLYKLALAQQPLTHIILKSKNPSPLPTNMEFHSFTSNLLIILLISNICTCVTPPPKKKTHTLTIPLLFLTDMWFLLTLQVWPRDHEAFLYLKSKFQSFINL